MLIDNNPFVFYTMVAVTLCAALLVAILPLSHPWSLLRPELLCMLMMYWVLSVPHHLGIGAAFIVGLLQDIVLQSIWGAHALALVVVAFVCVSSYQRINSYSLWHQSIWIGVLVGLHQLLSDWILGFAGYSGSLKWVLSSVVISTLIWPFLTGVLNKIRRIYHMV